MLCLVCIKVNYLPVCPCTASCARADHYTSSAMLKQLNSQASTGVTSYWPRPMKAAGDQYLEVSSIRMLAASGELQDAGVKGSIAKL